jgi:ATP-binding cassette subfamily C protein CydD
LVREGIKYEGLLVITILSGFCGALFTVFQAYFFSQIIESVFLDGDRIQDTYRFLWPALIFIILRSLTVFFSETSAGLIAVRVKAELRKRLLNHLFLLGPAFTREERSGEVTTVIVEGVAALEAYFNQYLPQIALAGLIPLTILCAIFPLDILSGVVLLVTAPLIPFFMVLIGKMAERLTQRQWKLLSRLGAHYLDVLQGLTTLKMLGQSKSQIENIRRISDTYAQVTLNVLRVAFLSALTLEMLATISTAIVAVEIGLRLLYGRLEFASALFILFLAPEFYLPLRLLGLRFHAGIQGTAAAERIFALLTAMPRKHLGVQSSSKKMVMGDIHFREIHLAYDEGARPSLNGVTFKIQAGKRIALIGPTGAGKSTVAGLLLGFLIPDSGQIMIGNTPLGEIPVDEVRQSISWLPQEPYIFNGTIEMNIRLANSDASEEELARAAQQAQLLDFIQSLPEGFKTIVGERGMRLSGGQRQRLALARAFLKQAEILILDEPSSQLDVETEEKIQDILDLLCVDKTVLIIAHRLTTVYTADHIIVFQKGNVIEEGTHESLLEYGGLYKTFIAANEIRGA